MFVRSFQVDVLHSMYTFFLKPMYMSNQDCVHMDMSNQDRVHIHVVTQYTRVHISENISNRRC